MKIGIIGSGNLGRTLGMLWAEKGHDVFFGARNKSSIAYIQTLATTTIKTGSLQEAVAFGDILFYSLREVLPSSLGSKDLFKDKILIDPNNGEVPPDFNYPPKILSYAEMYQKDIPEAFIVKAFNTMAQEIYYRTATELQPYNLVSPFCADQEEAKRVVINLIHDTGIVPLDCGTIRQGAVLLENFADLTRLLMINKQMGVNLGFSYAILPASLHSPYGVRQATKYT